MPCWIKIVLICIYIAYFDSLNPVAKEQGLRSRAAFKLSQINRNYPVLDNAKVVLDLCAAPGGWTQIASRVCGASTQIVAVDILPIRNLGNRNITTIVGDITTDKCKADVNRAIMDFHHSGSRKRNPKDGLVDVVLHDGAPNIGASYDKDAYEQMELSVHALRCATQHLKANGCFVTKIYRSRDSASFQWVVQQLFKEVSVFKPKASRPQSAEIFYICEGYYRPDKIDPRLLDPKHIFEFVQGDTTGGSIGDGAGNKNFHVFHKNWDKAKRQRGGYDTEHLDGTLRHIQPLKKFVTTEGQMPAIQLLSSCTGFSFNCEVCRDKKTDDSAGCPCHFLLHHPLTTFEIKECVVDLKVLNKGDFKGLMLWREKMLAALEATKDSDEEENSVNEGASDDKAKAPEHDNDALDSDAEEEEVQKEIQALRERRMKEKKKLKKKERKLAAKKRRQVALGMDLNAVEVQEEDQFFSLNTLKSSKDLNRVSEVNLDQATDEQVFGAESDDESDDDADKLKGPDKDEDTGYSYRMEKDLDSAYDRYLESTKNGAAKSGTKASKRSKKLMREKLAQESHEDQELLLSNKAGLNEDTRKYAEMLQGPKDSDDEDGSSSDEAEDGDDDDGFHSEPMTPGEHNAKRRKTSATGSDDSNPLIHKFNDESKSLKTARWFSNPLFSSIGQAAESAQGDDQDASHDESEAESDDNEADEKPNLKPKKRNGNGRNRKETLSSESETDEMNAENILAMMPKTDKEKRHEKRIKAIERDERRQSRKAKRLGEQEGEFDLAPAEDMEDTDEEEEIARMEGISEQRKQKLLEARRLIKAGMGNGMADDAKGGNTFEVVEADRPLPVQDHRSYNSDNEDYDSDDYAKTMALGTMMMRKSKAKALVDASYNRFAWNDPQDLPEWFVDDENRHYRPQLPIPQALIDKMKEKMAVLSTKPIAKVAEARARKSRKAKQKLAAAKKKAQAVAGSSDISEAMKLKQISKALRSDEGNRGSKQYIVSKKGKKGVKGAVMVDKRLRSDKKSMDRAQKKRKGGKKGGLTGTKKRRQHS